MGVTTGIEWTDATWNPLRGCSRVSEGCRNCYAERVAFRFRGPGQPYEGLAVLKNGHPSWAGRVELVDKHLLDPLQWRSVIAHVEGCKRSCDEGNEYCGCTRPRRIFVNSMSDLFHELVPDAWIDRIFAVMALCPQHTFQILTKRPERMLKYLMAGNDRKLRVLSQMEAIAGCHVAHVEDTLPNVWLGVSVENQATADERIPLLLQTPAAVRFISAEPLLGLIDLENLPSASGIGRYLSALSNAGVDRGALIASKLDWVICGGESGPGARPMHPDWARLLRGQCIGTGTPFFFKQWGEWLPAMCDGGHEACSGDQVLDCSDEPVRVGKKAAGALLDGVEYKQFPEARGAGTPVPGRGAE